MFDVRKGTQERAPRATRVNQLARGRPIGGYHDACGCSFESGGHLPQVWVRCQPKNNGVRPLSS
jgi:hypothetical protein